MQLHVYVYCETEYFESKECHGKICTMSLITSFTFSVPIVKATGLSFSVVRRSNYILVLNNKKFMCLYSFYFAVMFIIMLHQRLACLWELMWYIICMFTPNNLCLQCCFSAVYFVFKTWGEVWVLISQLWSVCIKDPSFISVVQKESGCWTDTVHHDRKCDSCSNVLGDLICVLVIL